MSCEVAIDPGVLATVEPLATLCETALPPLIYSEAVNPSPVHLSLG